MNIFIDNAHRFCLTRIAAERLDALSDREARQAALRAIIRGLKPGWVCTKCGITVRELFQLGTLVGSNAIRSSLAVHCIARPRTVAQYCIDEPATLGKAHMPGRRETTVAKVLGDVMIEHVENNDWMVPVLVTTSKRYLKRI